MGIDPSADKHTITLQHDDNGDVDGVTDAITRKPWDVVKPDPLPPDWTPPGKVLRLRSILLMKTQENPSTCWYIIMGGRAYKICQPPL
jgi:hypothetical protein